MVLLILRAVNDHLCVLGGGDVKIESHKMSIKGQPKVGSMENVKHEPGGGNVKVRQQQKT